MATHVTTFVTNNTNLFYEQSGGQLKGICLDLWEKVAFELNLTYDLELANSWEEMFVEFELNKTHVIMQHVDDAQMIINNVSKDE